jgi:heme a synthase
MLETASVVNRHFSRFTWFILVFIFLVILAGSIVRATQSGMGCPDWPTCFGNKIPPTSKEQVLFQPNHSYKKKQFIIVNDSLKYAKESFVSGANFNAQNWQQYEKHNYAKFELMQTWIEYINRLLTVVFGLLIFAHLIWSLTFWKKDKWIALSSLGLLLLTGFEAWLGKVLVDTNLGLMQISLHMLGSLLIAFLCVWLIHRIKPFKLMQNDNQRNWVIICFAIVFMQIILGTIVRSEIDAISKSFGYLFREKWVAQMTSIFQVHRLFAFAVAAIIIRLFIKSNVQQLKMNTSLLMGVVIAEMIVGFALTALDMPAIAQPIHLVLSSILIVGLFYRLSYPRLK